MFLRARRRRRELEEEVLQLLQQLVRGVHLRRPAHQVPRHLQDLPTRVHRQGHPLHVPRLPPRGLPLQGQLIDLCPPQVDLCSNLQDINNPLLAVLPVCPVETRVFISVIHLLGRDGGNKKIVSQAR